MQQSPILFKIKRQKLPQPVEKLLLSTKRFEFRNRLIRCKKQRGGLDAAGTIHFRDNKLLILSFNSSDPSSIWPHGLYTLKSGRE